LKLQESSGLDLLQQFRDAHREVAVIVLTQYGTIDSAVSATRLGAVDYVTKPFRVELRSRLERVARAVELQQENRLLREQLRTRPGFGGLIGISTKMQAVYRMIEKVSQHEYPVLILGESGTGKEMVARSIHFSGPRKDRTFAPVDCSSLVPTLIESELFGYVKGAFTGAIQAKQGLLEAASGGTLFLDEIGDMPVDLQAKLLRALQEREVKPVGSTERRHINVRIIAATNRDLETAIRSGTFRQDLYFRLNVVHAALGQLITTVVHELNNPLTSILGYSQRLLENAQTAAIERELRHIFQEAERATGILKQLLLNAHEGKVELRVVSINEVVRQAIELQQVSLAQEKINVLLDLDPAWPMVHGDAGQLQQVLMNLTGNARQALDQTGRGGTIRIRTKQIGAQRVLLEIADDGPGISEEILGRIFDPFFTTKPAGTGTGLGLAIVLGIVREHGGHVNVASAPKGGAVFSIALRATSGAPRTGIPAAPGKSFSPTLSQTDATPVSATATPVTDLSGAPNENLASRATNRILVVEDEPTVARLIAEVLEDEGFRVDVVLDGR
jgi:signal transduction histidine kinase